MRKFTVLILLCLTQIGCQSFRPNYSLFKSESESNLDSLWRQGHGFNNPNIERVDSGKSPLNFNGNSNDFRGAAKDIGERALGNAIVFGVFEAVPALFRGIGNKLKK